MQDMKKLLNIILAACVMASCSLKEDHDSFTNRENSYETVAQCQACVDACYLAIKNIYVVHYCWAVEVPTDLWYVNTSTPDPKCEISPSKPGVGTTVWTQCYQAIMRCNECIECIGGSTIPDDAKASLIAEARVLRALYYYHLTNFFGDVPYYTCMVKDLEVQEQIRLLPRKPADEIRKELYTDLKENALPYLPQVRTSDAAGNRAGYALGAMLMAKFAMWYQDWTEAEYALGLLENIYGEFSEAAYPLDDTRWSIKNTRESIFEIQHAWNAAGTKFQGTLCRTYYPGNIAKTWDNKDVDEGVVGAWNDGTFEGYLDDVYMPDWGREIPSTSVVRATWHMGCFRDAKDSTAVQKETTSATYCHKDRLFDPLPLKFGTYNKYTQRWNAEIDTLALQRGYNSKGKIDRRIRYVLGLGNMDPESETYGQTFKEIRTEGRPYAGEKFWVPGMVANYDSNNYKILRYADAVLMMAEVKCMQGLYEDAMTYLNKVRARAAVDPLTGMDEETVMKHIRDERARELAGELHRKYDLVRWGIWYDETLKYAPSGTKNYLQANIQPCHEYYPIPDTECALTVDETGKPVLSNPAYEAMASVEAEGDNEEQEE